MTRSSCLSLRVGLLPAFLKSVSISYVGITRVSLKEFFLIFGFSANFYLVPNEAMMHFLNTISTYETEYLFSPQL